MRKITRWLCLALCYLSCCFLIGCISTQYVERKQYLLDVPKSTMTKTNIASRSSIFVEHVFAAPPFDRLDFLYRVESGRYLVDYYNGFLVTPAEQLEQILGGYLNNFNVDTSLFMAPNRLQVKLIELYADYRRRDKPTAVIALQFHLTTMVDGKNITLSNQVFQANIVLKKKNTESLLEAWNEGLKDVLARGMRMLNQTLRGLK